VKIAEDIAEPLGGTRLVKLRGLSQRSAATIVGKLVVTVSCDTGERYLSTPQFAEPEPSVEPAGSV
jgi:cysteine synthase